MIYLDNAATTPVEKEINDIITYYNCEQFYNPSALYGKASDVRKEIDNVREKISNFVGVGINGKVIFTSGATEANNLAIFGSVLPRNKKFLFGISEHPAVYNCAQELKNKGNQVEFISLSTNGEINYDDLKSKMDSDVCFVSIMMINNETGACNDINKIAHIIKSVNANTILHVDAVQGFCKYPINMLNSKIDLLTISAHKINGPKGIGALIISPKIKIKNINFGGGQENGLRSGTENISGIMALGKICKLIDINKIKILKQSFIDQLESIKKYIKINGDGSPYILSISIPGLRGETLVHMMEQKNIIIGTGSACSSSKISNRTLENMGKTKEDILGSVRISFNKLNTVQEVEYAGKEFATQVLKLKQMYERK